MVLLLITRVVEPSGTMVRVKPPIPAAFSASVPSSLKSLTTVTVVFPPKTDPLMAANKPAEPVREV